MPATLPIPPECREHLDKLDELLDLVSELNLIESSRAEVRWGINVARRHQLNPDRVYVEIVDVPGHTKPIRKTGQTINHAATAVLNHEWPEVEPSVEAAA